MLSRSRIKHDFFVEPYSGSHQIISTAPSCVYFSVLLIDILFFSDSKVSNIEFALIYCVFENDSRWFISQKALSFIVRYLSWNTKRNAFFVCNALPNRERGAISATFIVSSYRIVFCNWNVLCGHFILARVYTVESRAAGAAGRGASAPATVGTRCL